MCMEAARARKVCILAVRFGASTLRPRLAYRPRHGWRHEPGAEDGISVLRVPTGLMHETVVHHYVQLSLG